MHVLILHSVLLLGQPDISSMISLPVERNSHWAVHSDTSIPFLWWFLWLENSNWSNIDLNFSLLVCIPALAAFTSISIVWSFPGKWRFYDIKTFLKITEITSKHFVETRSGRRAGQIAEFLASLFSSNSARLGSCHAALPRLFRLFWSYEPFLREPGCCRFYAPRLPGLSVPAAGRQLPHGPAPHVAMQGSGWHRAHWHVTLQSVQQAILQHQKLIRPFSAISTVNCWQVSKRYFEVKKSATSKC